MGSTDVGNLRGSLHNQHARLKRRVFLESFLPDGSQTNNALERFNRLVKELMEKENCRVDTAVAKLVDIYERHISRIENVIEESRIPRGVASNRAQRARVLKRDKHDVFATMKTKLVPVVPQKQKRRSDALKNGPETPSATTAPRKKNKTVASKRTRFHPAFPRLKVHQGFLISMHKVSNKEK